MKQTHLNIGLLGNGAIGSLFSYYLSDSKLTIFIRSSSSQAKSVVDLEKQTHIIHHDRKLVTEQNLADIDILIITVKAYQTESVARELAGKISKHTQVLLIQNGMGGHEILHQFLPKNTIYAGITTDAIYALNSNTYQITATGELDIGLMCQTIEYPVTNKQIATIKALIKHHPNATFRSEIKPYLFNKLAINAIINPLTALHNVKNGQLLEFKEQYTDLIDEVVQVFDYLGVQTNKEILTNRIEYVMQATKDNYSSMHQDYHHNRMTEIDSMLGFLIKHADQGNIKVDFMRHIYQQIVLRN